MGLFTSGPREIFEWTILEEGEVIQSAERANNMAPGETKQLILPDDFKKKQHGKQYHLNIDLKLAEATYEQRTGMLLPTCKFRYPLKQDYPL